MNHIGNIGLIRIKSVRNAMGPSNRKKQEAWPSEMYTLGKALKARDSREGNAEMGGRGLEWSRGSSLGEGDAAPVRGRGLEDRKEGRKEVLWGEE